MQKASRESMGTADSKKAPLGRFFTLVGRAGFEPPTNGLKVNCYTT